MTASDPAPSTHSRERGLVLALALLAGVRIFLSAAALPPFAVTDEQAHYDLILKYARGYLPGVGTDHFDEEASLEIVLHASPEYLNHRESYPDGLPVPLTRASQHIRDSAVPPLVARWLGRHNHEAYSPPVYYAFAALWYHAGQLVGLRGGSLIYWLRFVNAPIHAALVVGSFLFVRRFHPQERLLRLAVPGLVAVFPQDVFFTINSDVLSPVLFLAAVYLLLEWAGQKRPSLKLSTAAGLVTAAVFLVKYSNVAILLLVVIVLGPRLLRYLMTVRPGPDTGPAVCLMASVSLPIVAWLTRNELVLGDLTGTATKVEYLGWTNKPLSELTNHPLFTPSGFGYFWSQTIVRYWCGEGVWFLETPTSPLVERFFVVATSVLMPAAVLHWLTSRRAEVAPATAPPGDASYLAMVAASIAFLAFLSLLFDFHNCWYPSRKLPYFTSGRLIIGTLVPFLVLIVHGAEWLGRRWRFATALILFAIVVVCLIAPANLLRLAAPSPYNWFHLE